MVQSKSSKDLGRKASPEELKEMLVGELGNPSGDKLSDSIDHVVEIMRRNYQRRHSETRIADLREFFNNAAEKADQFSAYIGRVLDKRERLFGEYPSADKISLLGLIKRFADNQRETAEFFKITGGPRSLEWFRQGPKEWAICNEAFRFCVEHLGCPDLVSRKGGAKPFTVTLELSSGEQRIEIERKLGPGTFTQERHFKVCKLLHEMVTDDASWVPEHSRPAKEAFRVGSALLEGQTLAEIKPKPKYPLD